MLIIRRPIYLLFSTSVLTAVNFGQDCSNNFDDAFGGFDMEIDDFDNLDENDKCGLNSQSENQLPTLVTTDISSPNGNIPTITPMVTGGVWVPPTETPPAMAKPDNLHGNNNAIITDYQNGKKGPEQPSFQDQYQHDVTYDEDYANDFVEGSDPTNLADQMGVDMMGDMEDWAKAKIFSNVMLPLKYDMLEPSSFIKGNDESLANQIQHSFDNAFKKSGLAAFGKGMNAIRPHIAYAIAISWNVQHYKVNITKLYQKEHNVNTVEGLALSDDKFSKADGSKIIDSMGRYSKLGDRSEVSDTLREVEQNFENFVVEIQIWAINSIGQIYKVVKNMQKAMKQGEKAMKYYKLSNMVPSNRNKIRTYNTYMEALLYFRTEMNHYLALIPKTLAKMVEGVEKMMRMLKNDMMIKIMAANRQTKMEQDVALRSDEEAKYGDETITKSIDRTNDYLVRVKEQIAKSESDLTKNIVNIKKYIDRKDKKRDKFRLNIQNLQAQKLLETEKQRKYLEKYQLKMRSVLEELSSSRNPIGTCNSEMFKACFRRITSTSKSEACFTHAMQHHSMNPECQMQKQEFKLKVKHYKDMQKEHLELYQKQVRIVNEKIAEITEERRQKDETLKEEIKHIDGLKNEKILNRKRILMLKENQLKGERFARVIKQDLVSSAEEFKSVAGTLSLTQLALREVFNSMNENLRNLNKFRVTLITMKDDILSQVSKFEDMKRRMCKVIGGREKIIGNPFVFKTELETVYTDNMRAGVGMVVMSRMYDSIFSFMTELDECPVGLYKANLSVEQNVKRFQNFVKKMYGQKDWNLDEEAEMKENKKQQESLNKKMKKEGIKGDVEVEDFSEAN